MDEAAFLEWANGLEPADWILWADWLLTSGDLDAETARALLAKRALMYSAVGPIHGEVMH